MGEMKEKTVRGLNGRTQKVLEACMHFVKSTKTWYN